MAETKTHSNVVEGPKMISKETLLAMGFKMTRTKKPITMTGDAKKDGKSLARRFFGECRKAYRRLESLSNGRVVRNKKEYSIEISKQQRDYMESQLCAMHEAVFEALRTGVKAADVSDFPD